MVIWDEYVKKDGMYPLYIYVNIDGKFDRIPLKISWSSGHFDKNVGVLLPRSKQDPAVSDYQIMIRDAVKTLQRLRKHGPPLRFRSE